MDGNRGIGATTPRLVSGGAEGKGPGDDKAVLALLTETLHRVCRMDPSACDLEVRDRIAYIHGSVNNLAQKRAVAQAAQAVPGLRGVVNDLRIAPLSPCSDRRIAAQVQAALAKGGVVPGAFQVRVVDGVVYLSGTLASLAAQAAAEETAWSVRGVEYVVDNTLIEPCPLRADEDILQDIQLTLGRCLRLEARQVEAEVRRGVVHLRGRVESDYQSLLIEDAVRWTPCVSDVVNELKVIAPPPN